MPPEKITDTAASATENTDANTGAEQTGGSTQTDAEKTAGAESKDTTIQTGAAGEPAQGEAGELKPRTLAEGEVLEEGQMLRGDALTAATDAAALAGIEAAAAPLKQPEVVQTQKPVVSEPAVAGESLSVIAVRHDLSEYIKNMAPGKVINETTGSFHQVKFFNVMLAVINRYSDDDFRASMNILVELFRKEAKGVFGEQYVFRFMEHVELSSPRIKLFQRLLNMFIVMAEPKSRKAAMKQLNWQETLSGEITNDGRNRVLKYFDVG